MGIQAVSDLLILPKYNESVSILEPTSLGVWVRIFIAQICKSGFIRSECSWNTVVGLFFVCPAVPRPGSMLWAIR